MVISWFERLAFEIDPFLLGQYRGLKVHVVATEASLHFYDSESIRRDHPECMVWRDKDEWEVRHFNSVDKCLY